MAWRNSIVRKKKRTAGKAAGSFFLKGASGSQADGSGTGQERFQRAGKIKEYTQGDVRI